MTAIQKSVPALRFKDSQGEDYPDWEKVEFKYLYSFKTTNSFSRNKLNYVNGKVRNLHYGDIHTKYQSVFDLDKENVPFLNLDIDLNSVSEDAYCKEGDLVIADASEDYHGIGKTIELLNLNGESVLSGLHTLLAKRNSDRIHIGYGAYVMACNIVRQQIMRIAQGTKVLGISVGRMNEIELPIPSKKEQQKIAAFLSSVNTKIKQLTKKKALLEQYKKGMMQKLFSQEIRFKDEQENDFPIWENKKLGNIGEIVGGGTPDTRQKSFWGGDIIWFTPTEIKSKYSGISVRKISKKGLTRSSAKLLPAGTVLLTSRATVGEVSIASLECTTNQGFQSLVVNDSLFSNEYVYYWILKNKKQFLRRAQGSTFLEINKREIGKISFNAPNRKEQEKIANFLSVIDKKIELVTEQIKQAQAFKKGLLQQMFI